MQATCVSPRNQVIKHSLHRFDHIIGMSAPNEGTAIISIAIARDPPGVDDFDGIVKGYEPKASRVYTSLRKAQRCFSSIRSHVVQFPRTVCPGMSNTS